MFSEPLKSPNNQNVISNNSFTNQNFFQNVNIGQSAQNMQASAQGEGINQQLMSLPNISIQNL